MPEPSGAGTQMPGRRSHGAAASITTWASIPLSMICWLKLFMLAWTCPASSTMLPDVSTANTMSTGE